MLPTLHLTPNEKECAAWLKLKGFYAQKLTNLRLQNDTKMGEQDRALLLGRIAEIKELLALDPEMPVVRQVEEESHPTPFVMP
jgi:hypothetical protein